jgi:molybdate transport system ATP-binding protein
MSIEARFTLERRAAAGSSPFSLDLELSLPALCVGIVGASGSGKTTLLRCIAGLERRARGSLSVQGEVWQDQRSFLPPHRRSLGYVFQESSLFPHLSVRDNLRYGERRVPEAARRVRFDDAVSLLGVESLLARDPASLSGGERQRVAIARALLTSPKLLLLDEPLASLDLSARAQILTYLEAVQRALALPMLYVTHAPNELTRIAAHVVLLEAGKLIAAGPLAELMARPDLALGQREDAGAVLDATLDHHDEQHHLSYLRVVARGSAREQEREARGSAREQVHDTLLAISRRPLAPGSATRLFVRARDVSLARTRPVDSSINNMLEVSVSGVHADRDPAYRLIRLDLSGSPLLARITALSVEQLALAPGMRVVALIKSASLVE